jgi:hypothetical protein
LFDAAGNNHAKFIFKRTLGLLRAREFGNDSGPVLGMNKANQVFEPEHIVLAKAKQKTQTRVGPEVTAFQIGHHISALPATPIGIAETNAKISINFASVMIRLLSKSLRACLLDFSPTASPDPNAHCRNYAGENRI